MPASQTVAGIEIFDDENLLHDIQPSLVGSFSTVDILLAVFSFGCWLVVPYLRWRNTRYIITDNRLIEIKGKMTGSATEEVSFDNIYGDIRTSQGLIEGVFDKGTIEFEVEKKRQRSTTEREFGDRDGGETEMNIERRSMVFSGIREYQELSNTIRRIANA